jgi:hypothetical protein
VENIGLPRRGKLAKCEVSVRLVSTRIHRLRALSNLLRRVLPIKGARYSRTAVDLVGISAAANRPLGASCTCPQPRSQDA